MFKKITKRIFPIVLAIVLIVSVTPVHVFAGTSLDMLDGALTLTDTASSTYSKRISVSGTTATLSAKGSIFGSQTNTVTILNKLDSAAELTFDYTLTNISKGSVSINGVSVGSNATGYSFVLSAGASLNIVITASGSTEVKIVLSNVALTEISGGHDVTVNYDSALGSVTSDGNTIASGTTQNVESVALVATASSGSTFLAWVDENTKQIISESATYTHYPLSAVTLKAVFVNSSSPAYFRVSGTYSYLYDDLNAASDMAATVSNKVIILANNGRLAAGDYTIDAGVTLLIPFDDANTLYTNEPGNLGTQGSILTGNKEAVPWSQPYVYRKLTMVSGANITVNGAISLSAKHANPNGNGRGAGSPSGPCSYIYMEENSNITVNANAALYAWGYIYGKGSVYAKSGSTIYENFQIEDFRGGTQTSDLADSSVFPMSQYYIQNIEVPLTIESGAKENCYTSIYMSLSVYSSNVGFFSDGTTDGSMFNLTRGTVTKRYDPATDRLIVELNGDMTISPISMSIGGTDLNSKDFVLPVNSNISIIANEGSNVTMAQDIAVLPGASITVKEGAEVKLNSGISVYLYDSEQWGGYVAPANDKFRAVQYSPSRTYTRTAADLVDAFIEVNGTLDATQGNFYTTAGGAKIFSTDNGVVKMGATTNSVTYQAVAQTVDGDQHAVPTEISVTPAKLLNGDGTYLQTGNDNYTYANDKWNCEKHIAGTEATCTEDQVCTVCGEVLVAAKHTYEAVVTAPTCTEQGYTTYTCACGDTYVDNYVDAKGHTAGADATCTENQVCTVCGEVLVAAKHTYEAVVTAPTCTEQGYTTYTCACGYTYVDNYVDATGHTAGADATCTENQVCTVCGEVLNAATGHNHNAVVTEPTCTEQGYTTYTCACGDTYVDNYVDAKGHTAGADATCTENQVCTVCGEVLNAATGHNHEAVVTAPTCTEQGYTTYTCACGDTYVNDYIDATGHTAGAEATCTENHVCTVCGDVLVEAHGHSYSDEWTVDVEPTHTTDGSKSHHCTVCGDKTDITVIEAYGYDINGNGETEITDYYYMKHLILGSAQYDEADLPMLDLNGDKKFDILDLIKYYTILQGII